MYTYYIALIIRNGVGTMATKSILKTIDIKDKSMGELLINALVKSETAQSKNIDLSRECIELKGDSVKDFLRSTNGLTKK